MPTPKEQRNRKIAAKITNTFKAEKRIEAQSKKRTAVTRKVARVEKNTRKNDLANQRQKLRQKEGTSYKSKRKNIQEHAGTIEKKRKIARKQTVQERNLNSGQRTHARKIKKQEKAITGRSTVALNKPQISKENEIRRQAKKGSERKVVQASSNVITGQSNKKKLVKREGSRDRRPGRNQTRMMQKKVYQIDLSSMGDKEKNRKSANGKRKEGKEGKKITGFEQNRNQQKTYQERQRTGKRSGRNFISASFDTRRFR